MNIITLHPKGKIGEESIINAVRRLRRVANVLEHRQFVPWYMSNESRFAWCVDEVHERLRDKLMQQLACLVSGTSAADMTVESLVSVLPERLRSIADKVSDVYGVKVPNGETSFAVRRGSVAAAAIIEELSHDDWILTLAKMDVDFYVRNALSELAQYARARLTLCSSTGYAWFEELLEGLSSRYLLAGWMNDILAIDAHSVRSGMNITGYVMHREYCSTWMYFDGERVQALHKGDSYVALRPAKLAA